MVNLCANNLVKTLPVPVEDIIVDTYYFFHGSSKQREEYREFQLFTGVDKQEVHMSLPVGCRLRGTLTAYLVSGLPSIVFLITTVIEWPGRVKRCA